MFIPHRMGIENGRWDRTGATSKQTTGLTQALNSDAPRLLQLTASERRLAGEKADKGECQEFGIEVSHGCV